MRYLRARVRWLALLSVTVWLAGCMAMPQTAFNAFRLSVTSATVENVRVGSFDLNRGLDTASLPAMLASSVRSGSLPIQATLALGLDLPRGMPAVNMAGFNWALDMPGADPVTGRYGETVSLTPGAGPNLRLPLSLDVLASDPQRLRPMIDLARELAARGSLPQGSELAITPGSLSGLGVTLPAGVLTPTLRFNVGPDGQLSQIR
ncbi:MULTISPECIES: hypothetical protein [unclassified Halomonas]|uniref:hypothetical protein n=1 Tax=unclassified Halomonas TaxID=2609666 RepID=UPI0021E4A3B2|nr:MULTISPECIES: hypothetical protein [unclassified Halomonas]UYF99233.1 hypothetical protein OCT39_13500 [Halomonas sp. GD1P12]WNL42967.1 hypothetical protein RN347_03470 [Halomonas sp. PAMB 3264]